jgi:predicted transcriptional regulator
LENRNLTASKFTQSMTDILKTLSDDKALVLFNTIALANGESEIQIRKMGLTTKQYYSRISKMINANLIRRKNGRYSLTLLGKIVYEAHMTIGKGLNYYWKLQALDSIQTSSSAGLPKEEFSKIIDTLIDNHQIKDILMKIPLPTVDQKSMDSTPQITTGAKEKMRLEEIVSYR